MKNECDVLKSAMPIQMIYKYTKNMLTAIFFSHIFV